MKKLLTLTVLCTLLLTLSACSTNKERVTVSKVDKWEKMNRKAFRFNKKLDKVLLKPVANTYKKVTPDIVETGVSNFFSNLGDIKNALNNALQFKLVEAGSDMTRFAFNTTFGLGGILDVASGLQLEKHHEDFGQTLAHWGVPSGPYTVTPFFGSSTFRDSYAFWVDVASNPASYLDPSPSTAVSTLHIVNSRANLLATEKIVESIAVDEYALVRDAWLQNRAYQISDGQLDVTQQDDLAKQLDD